MERETLKTKHRIRWGNRPLNSLLPIYDLPILVKCLEKKRMMENGELSSIILLERPEKQVVLTSVNKGIEIEFFQTKKPVTIQIIEGEVKFWTFDNVVSLGKGKHLELFENKLYKMTACEKTLFLLMTKKAATNSSVVNIPIN